MECVRRTAPGASQVAPRQTNEYARQARACAFALNRFENFRDTHFCSGGFTPPALECGGSPPLFRLRPSRGLRDLDPLGIRLASAPSRQPLNRAEEKNPCNN